MDIANGQTYPEAYDELYLPIISDASKFDALSDLDQAAFCVYILEMEVNNGGFDQFFFNSTGQFAIQAVSALEAIGAEKTASLLKDAISIAYPTGYPKDGADHQSALSDTDDVLEQLGKIDEKFYKYEDNLAELVNEYLQSDT